MCTQLFYHPNMRLQFQYLILFPLILIYCLCKKIPQSRTSKGFSLEYLKRLLNQGWKKFFNQRSKKFVNQGFNKYLNKGPEKVSHSSILKGPSIKEHLHKNVNQIIFSIEREVDYCQRKSSSCLTSSQLKIECLRKLKTFKKICKIFKIKSKSAAGKLELRNHHYKF